MTTIALPLVRPLRSESAVGSAPDIAAVMAKRAKDVRLRVLVAMGLAVIAMLFFLLYGALDAWQIIAALRIKRLAGLVVVAVALSAATVLFQTVTRNRILSPSVMGFDAMFALVATSLVFFLSARVTNLIPPALMFALQASLMALLSVTMFLAIMRKGRASTHLLVLVGIVVGALLRSITTMMSIIMDPNEFLTVQDLSTASFAAINTSALGITALVTMIGLAYAIKRSRDWDVLALGPDMATCLGLNYSREVKTVLATSALLVSAATALVGPLMFFGLLVANIAVHALGSTSIRHLVPGASAIGIIVLVGGQAILEHVLSGGTILPVVIELVGGALLLVMLVRGSK
ncbi:MAG: iron chelate uptake ABC transporter family permease subunit [Actinomyces sp.]|uniref:iron chelate uptake ABC transporter family permease subunit n=1 Tax=Actinomyces sp. TaxID=29317 RepID=UPI001EBB1F11|nr:iron chelate uptake ABC transporter family permease subunit [Actinomyces sp.]MBS5825642.1 iron chelate uptake ABC transporter family permease subunit [Actinomyces sp.]